MSCGTSLAPGTGHCSLASSLSPRPLHGSGASGVRLGCLSRATPRRASPPASTRLSAAFPPLMLPERSWPLALSTEEAV